ncbi:MAG: UDP-N-acetylmuramoyl-L-alanine--D-glutamate ligase [Thermodesulfobacteriota bacterium]
MGEGSAKALNTLSGRKVLVVGLGRSGVSVSRFLRRSGAEVTATDISPVEELFGAAELLGLGVVVEAGAHNPESFLGADMIVVSPGVPRTLPELVRAAAAGVEVVSDIELACRFIEVPIVAVTGTNGKSTVVELLGAVLGAHGRKVFVGGNIGTPVTEYFEGAEDAELVVLEVSSFHLEAIETFRPHVAVLLNVTEDHLYRYREFEEYAETKMRIFSNQGADDYAVINVGDRVVADAVSRAELKAAVIPFTGAGQLDEGLYRDGGDIVFASAAGRELYPTGGFKLKGLHNIENVMAAVAAARTVGVPRETIVEAVNGFRGLPHRMEPVREFEGVGYVNDSKATNTDAVLRAIEATGGPVVLLAGGVDKGGDYGVLREAIGRNVRLLVLMGEARSKMKEALGDVTETVLAGGLAEAVETASAAARAGDTVLLSPACSSFDMFESFEERGEAFKELVMALR